MVTDEANGEKGKGKEAREINLTLDNIKAQIIKHYRAYPTVKRLSQLKWCAMAIKASAASINNKCEYQARKILHPLLGVQQWRGRFPRLVYYSCVLQFCQETGRGIVETDAVLQGICATIWVQTYRN